MTRAPLTTDREMLDLLDRLGRSSTPCRTARPSAWRWRAPPRGCKDSAAKTKVMVLVTDGANNAGAIDPVSAAALCKGLGIKVYTIGVGSAGRVPVPMPTQDPVTGQTVIQRGDDERAGGRGSAAADRRSARAGSSTAPPTARACGGSSTRSTGWRRRRCR